ncbi:phosphodiesterase [Idiomarinaceae phage Phi1M2-2]|uniref:phosphodiesterase n=1 Tax=Idiomarinaceae phage Phi1M2-2 TaxID=1527515 RepID=UPI0004F7C7A4|nr:phosphodiesterase [Idiomarinaceae phage Phi1M2-2]AIM40790.1 putative phosphodiesterase/alkaline phosphatase [Idiomarinaceae phage Phi1M2-2]
MSKVTVTVKMKESGNFRIVADTSPQFTNNPLFSSALTPHPEYGFARGDIEGLQPGTLYYVSVEKGGVISNVKVGRVKTPPTATVQSFAFGTASCADTGSTARIFDVIRGKAESGEIDFYFHLGDMHYDDVIVNNEAVFHSAYDATFNAFRQGACWRSMPLYYVWDDHDYGPNDSDRDSPSRQAAVAAYRNRVPSPELVKSGIEDAPYFSFVRGRVRFIGTDVRSERAVKGEFPTTDPRQIVFSEDQLQWFFGELLAAKSAGQIICWANAKPWITAAQTGEDGWGGYDAQKQEIGDFIIANDLTKRMFIISGDMHALAFDDGGRSANYGDLKVIQSAAMDRIGSIKGTGYSTGPFTDTSGYVSQYTIVAFDDNGGGEITVTSTGYRVNRDTGAETVMYSESFPMFAEAE